MKAGMVILLLTITALCCADYVGAQEFPYAAPIAPEFDGNGRASSSSSAPDQTQTVQPGNRLQPRQSSAPREHSDYKAVRPYAPQAPQLEEQEPQPKQRSRRARDHQGPPQPGGAPDPGMRQPPQQPQRSDCTQFPMLIARAQSETEMQMTARHYLTCLLQNGWQMDQAKQQVIATIESTYRLPR